MERRLQIIAGNFTVISSCYKRRLLKEVMCELKNTTG